MSITVVTPPTASNLSLVSRLEAELGEAADQAVLADILARAGSAISRYCNRPLGFGTLTVTETLRGSGSQLLGVTYVPLLSIDQVLQDTQALSAVDPTNPADPNAEDGYYVEDTEAGAIYRASGWGQTVALMSWGWEAYASRYILPGGTLTQRYLVTYTAGYALPGQPGANLPGEVEQACLVTAKAWWFARARDLAVGSERTADEAVVYAPFPVQSGMLPAAALGMLRDYRRPA